MAVFAAYKREGETPLACLERMRKERGIPATSKLTYLGRLDPMAEGVLLIGEGVTAEEREKYLSQEKEYLVEMLFGFASDTYDILGLLTEAPTRAMSARITMHALLPHITALPGVHVQAFPPYSSKPAPDASGVKRPLHALSREGVVPEVVPAKEIVVHSAVCVRVHEIGCAELAEEIGERIARVRGDFRQEKISACWEETLRHLSGMTFTIATLMLTVSSGTYVRSIAHELGHSLGVPALAHRIIRRRVGEYAVVR